MLFGCLSNPGNDGERSAWLGDRGQVKQEQLVFCEAVKCDPSQYAGPRLCLEERSWASKRRAYGRVSGLSSGREMKRVDRGRERRWQINIGRAGRRMTASSFTGEGGVYLRG